MHPGDARDNRHLSVLNPLDPNVLHHANKYTHGHLSHVRSAPLYRLPEPPYDRALKHARFVDKSHLLATNTLSVPNTNRHVTETEEPSAAPPPSTVLDPLPISQNQQFQFQYLPEYDWTPTSSSVSYLPLFTPTDQPAALPLPGLSRPFSSHGPTSHSPFPLLGTGMLSLPPDGHTAPVRQPSTDSQKEMARDPSAPPPSIRKSSRPRSGARGSDKDSTGDDHDAAEDALPAAVADSSVSRIRRTWASIYEDDVLTSDDRTLPAAKRRRIYILSLERHINVIQYCLERNNMVVVVASAAGRDTFRTVGAKKSKLTLAAFQKDLSALRKRLAHVYSEIDRLRDSLQPTPIHQVHQGYHYPNHAFHH